MDTSNTAVHPRSPLIPWGFFLTVGGVWTFLAIVADYLSLWKTRILLTRSRLLGNALTAVGVVVGDAFATLVIALAVAEIIPLSMYLIIVLANDPEAAPLRDQFRIAAINMTSIPFSWPHIVDNDLSGLTRLLFLAPLFTSAWLWVYLLVAYAMRAANYLPSWLRPLSKVMDLESHPVRTMGYVAATVCALIVGIITLV